MKISIVMSTYNGQKYIYEQMESLFRQEREPDEVLIFDDCSQDRTNDLIKSFIKKNQLINWKLIVNKNNKGWRRNFMEGLWQASGDIIMPCDQDDIWLPNKLKEVEKIFSSNLDVDLLTSNCIAFYEDGHQYIRPQKEDGKTICQKIKLNFFETIYPGCTYAVSRRLVEMSKKYWEKEFPHDAMFWRMATYLGTAYSYNKSLIKWRKHSTSTYTIESVAGKSFKKKREWLNYAETALISMTDFIYDNHVVDIKMKSAILNYNRKAIKLRKKFYDKKNPIFGIMLLFYLPAYPRKRQIIGDWYLVARSLWIK